MHAENVHRSDAERMITHIILSRVPSVRISRARQLAGLSELSFLFFAILRGKAA